MPEKVEPIEIKMLVKTEFQISLWNAIKIRIAGKHIGRFYDSVITEMKKSIMENRG